MVIGDDLVAEEARGAREAVADDRAADVTDVHRLGDVGRRVIDDDTARRGNPGDAEARVRKKRCGSFTKGALRQVKVDKTRARDFEPHEIGGSDGPDGSFGQVSGVFLEDSGENEGSVCLVMPEARVGGRRDLRRKCFRDCHVELLKGLGDKTCEKARKVG